MCWCAVETLTAAKVLLTFMLSVDLSFDMKKTRRVSWGEGAQSTTFNFYTRINHQNQVWCIYLFDRWGNVVKTTYTAVLFTLHTLHSFLYPEHPSVNVCVVVGNLQLLSCSFRDNYYYYLSKMPHTESNLSNMVWLPPSLRQVFTQTRYMCAHVWNKQEKKSHR